jgi:solute carrier family 25 oxoglutarate transporter 11
MAAAEKPLSTGVIFGTSGLGGIAGWMCVHPFNTLAVRMNLATMGANAGPQLSFAQFASKLIKTEGFASLYNGLGAGCLRQVFYATSRYGLFEKFRDVCAQYRKTDFAQRFATASVAGGCAAVISCPIEVCLVRMSNDASLPLEQQRGYKNVIDAIIRIAKEDGFGAFYQGVQPFAMRAMLVGGTQVATYDQFKMTYAGFGISGIANQFCSSMSAGERWRTVTHAHAHAHAHAGAHTRATRASHARVHARSAGLIYSIVTMPFETAKNRMAFQKLDPITKEMPYRGTFQTIGKIAAADGVLSLWWGFLPYYGRCGGHTVTMFIFVDQIRTAYRKNFMADK